MGESPPRRFEKIFTGRVPVRFSALKLLERGRANEERAGPEYPMREPRQ